MLSLFLLQEKKLNNFSFSVQLTQKFFWLVAKSAYILFVYMYICMLFEVLILPKKIMSDKYLEGLGWRFGSQLKCRKLYAYVIHMYIIYRILESFRDVS